MASTPRNKSYAQPLLLLQDIRFDYANVSALKNVSISIGASEIHAIVGEHGAGKSSLAKIASGMLKPLWGHIVFDGIKYTELTAAKALALGIEMVYQDVQLFDYLTVVEHFYLPPKSGPPLPQFLLAKRQSRVVGEFLARFGFEINPLAYLRDLSRTDQILVDILRSLFRSPKLLILDEVFERISTTDLSRFMPFLKQRRDEGMSILLVTHKIEDVYLFADIVSIVKDGQVLLTGPVTDIDKMNLIKLTYTQVVSEDQLKSLGEEFYEHLRYNEAILQFLPVILLVIDRNCLVKMINVSACEYFQVERKEYLNTPFDSLFTPGNEETVHKIQQSVLALEKRTLYSVPLKLAERRSIVNLIIYPIQDGSYSIGHMIIIEDHTEQEQLRTQLILSEKLASVGLLAAGVAHEINNPLGIITNYLQSIKFKFADEELKRRIGQVEEQIQFICTIVSQLLMFSDSGKMVQEDINVVEVIRDLVDFVQYSFRNSKIRVHFSYSENPITIHANQGEIKQIVLNLLRNSLEAMPKGGLITITVDTGTETAPLSAIIRFRDSGPGIKHEALNDVFLPFYSTKRAGNSQNLGLGLSVTYSIVQKYNGSIFLENLEAGGCQFTIRIPCSAQEARSSSSEAREIKVAKYP
jgi:two-component system sensor histidine kinase AtoS